MKSVFMLAAANLRRHKGAGFSLGLMVLIAALLLHLGMLSGSIVPRIFAQKINELHTPYSVTLLSDELGAPRQNEIEQYIKNYPGVTQTQSERAIYLSSAIFALKSGGNYSNSVIAESTNEAGTMGKLKFVGQKMPQTDTSIYVPFILQSKGYRLGDSFTITYSSKQYHFKIAGFTEDLMFGLLDTGGVRVYLPDSAYRRFVNELNDSATQAVLISARTEKISQASDLYDNIHKNSSKNAKDSMLIGVFGIDITKLATSMPVDIASAMEISFAFVVAFVLLLVVRFRIVNSIEEDMRNIGAFEAVGYTSRQIRGAYLLQFLMITLCGSVLGITLAYAAAVPYGKILTSETGIDWTCGFDLPVSLLTLAIMLFCTALVAFISTRRLRKLPVIMALRGGISTHSFRRNHLPLERAYGPLNLLLPLKNLLANVRHNVALVIILAAVSFASIFTCLLFYNFTIDDTAVIHTMGGETDDILVAAKTPDDAQFLLSQLPKQPHITQAIDYGFMTFEADGKTGYGRITTDYKRLRNNQTYAGRYPRHDNEAAIGGILAETLHKGIGDTIRISVGGNSADYIITGLTQNISELGKGIHLTTAGLQRVQLQYRPALVYVYIEKGYNVNREIQALNEKYGSRISAISNEQASTKSMLGTYETIVAGFSMCVFAVMAVIVMLILTLITGAALVRRRREFGIEKALGFTTRQLMQQVSVSFIPVALIGSLIGSLAGWLWANPLMACMFRAMGIMKTDFYLPVITVPIVCVAIVLLSYIISLLAAGRVRRISPCALVNE